MNQSKWIEDALHSLAEYLLGGSLMVITIWLPHLLWLVAIAGVTYAGICYRERKAVSPTNS